MRNPFGMEIANQYLAEAILDQAIAYVEAGISVLPLRLDGSKGPAIKWKSRQSARPRWKELERDFSKPAGIGVVSGGLEVLDFDAAELFEPWRKSIAGIAGKLPIVKAPKKGFHLWFRCPFAQPRQRLTVRTVGGRPLAMNYTPSNSPVSQFKALCRMAAAKTHQGAPLTMAVAIEVTFIFARPKSVGKKYGSARLPHVSRPDLDNVLKSLLDALSGLIFLDDSQVHVARVEKWKAAATEQPHTLVRISSE
jgi:Holliday junction resolvase RusA-like endonuclease